MKRFFFIIIILVLGSCTKDKRISQCFWKGETWQLSSVTVDDVTMLENTQWEINKCDIYDELCESVWISENGDVSNFNWQFNEKAKEFKLARVSKGDTICKSCNESDYYSHNFSGTYQVIKAKKKEMIFESETTVGYAGQKVRLVLQRKED